MRLVTLVTCFGLTTFGLTSAALAQDGRAIFENQCAHCHGGDASGGEGGPNIVQRINSRSTGDLGEIIRAGRPQSGMPAFAMAQPELDSLTVYLKKLVPVSFSLPKTVARKSVMLTNGQTVEGRVLGEGFNDLQLYSEGGANAANRVHLLRKTADGRYREVTSQTDWPNYHGDFGGNRYTKITQIDKSNVAKLAPKWVLPIPGVAQMETTPVVVGGIMYVSSANEIFALDAGSGRQIFHYQRPRTKGLGGNAAGGINRGVAVEGNRVFMLTDNAHAIALNRFNGELLWDSEMADWHQNYNATAAPLAAKGMVISGVAGGDEGVRGFVAGYDAATGKEVWRFWTVPNPGEPGSETWKGKLTEHRGGATWMSGSYDPETDTIYWPTGNPGSDFDGDNRQGDNLYSDCIVALDARTGKLKWYYQFTPHDIHDWDAQEPPVLIDTLWQGKPRKLLIQANRNGFFYVLDRTNGELLLGKPFLKKLNWATGIGKDGRPMLADLKEDKNGETYVCPGFQGGTNWFSTSFNPGTGLYYFQALERCNLFSKREMEWAPLKGFMAGSARPAPDETMVKSLRAVNIQTGAIVWDLPQAAGATNGSGGVISTASGLVFFAENGGDFVAADGATGKVLWSFPTNQSWRASPMSYVFDNKQYFAVAVGQNIMAFALPE